MKAKKQIRMVDKPSDLDPIQGLENLPKIKAHGYVIIPNRMASDLESVIWVSPSNFLKIKRELAGKSETQDQIQALQPDATKD